MRTSRITKEWETKSWCTVYEASRPWTINLLHEHSSPAHSRSFPEFELSSRNESLPRNLLFIVGSLLFHETNLKIFMSEKETLHFYRMGLDDRLLKVIADRI